MKNRIYFIDGIRGLAAIIILLSHIVSAFYPILHSKDSRLLDSASPLIKVITCSPLNIFYYGSWGVVLFFIISGYVITYNYFNFGGNNYITSSAFRRYFRLTIPALISCFIAYVLLKYDLFYNVKISPITQSLWLDNFYHFEANIFDMLKFAIYDEYFNFGIATNYRNAFLPPQVSYNAVLWVMRILFFGSMLIYSFLAIFGKVGKRYILYIPLITLLHNSFYLCYILGMILCDLDVHNRLKGINRIILSIIILLSIYISSVRTFDFPFYSILKLNYMNDQMDTSLVYIYQSIGAFLFIFAISRYTILSDLFSTKIMLHLGKLSLPIFVLQLPIICSVSCYLYLILINRWSHNESFIIISFITIIITLLSSHLFYYAVEDYNNNLSKTLFKLINQ